MDQTAIPKLMWTMTCMVAKTIRMLMIGEDRQMGVRQPRQTVVTLIVR